LQYQKNKNVLNARAQVCVRVLVLNNVLYVTVKVGFGMIPRKGKTMPKIEQVTLTHEQLVSISCRMADRLHRGDQGIIEWALFRAASDELGVDLFELREDECTCGDKKDPTELICGRCREIDREAWEYGQYYSHDSSMSGY
jgi:hypothetical protein